MLHSLVVKQSSEVVFHSDGRGLRPLALLFLEKRRLLEGAVVFDKVVGEAAARLLILSHAKEVSCSLASAGAASLLKQAGIPLHAEAVVERILNEERSAPCGMEELSRKHSSDDEFVECLRKAFQK